jgi:hypothetical protein
MAKTKQNQFAFKQIPVPGARRRRGLILPRYLQEEASKAIYRGEKQDRAYEVIKKWADLEAKGHLNKKETALDADFLLEVFRDALGYSRSTESPDCWELERNYFASVGTADGALGNFRPNDLSGVRAVIELKDADVDLDRDKFNGRTPVQQCWDYLNALPQCPWGIVSNFVTIRLYHRDRTPLAYEEFRLQDLTRIDKFREFYCLLDIQGLLKPTLGRQPRALELLERTENRQREVSDELYEGYSQNRLRLIGHLTADHGKSLDAAIHIAQKVLDRIIFVAFCEDRGLLPSKCIEDAYKQIPPFSKVVNPRWQNFLDLFRAIDSGHQRLHLDEGYNGGLFKHDPEVDDLQLDDEWTKFFHSISRYDFRDEVNVDVLGNIFEKSITELEKLRTGGMFAAKKELESRTAPSPQMPKSAQRKRFGVYYTPPEFTRFIVDNTLGKLIDERYARLREQHGLDHEPSEADNPSPELAAYWRDCLHVLRELKVCDPACGSGAFLIQTYDHLEDRYIVVCNNLFLHGERNAEDLANAVSDFILGENLYGVDLSEQAVEITQLALWIRSARRGRTLADLSSNIVRGNSLVTDPDIDPHAFIWPERFDDILNRPEGGFDCVIGNPPWERLKLQEREFFSLSAPEIAGAVSAAQRRTKIKQLGKSNPGLFEQYTNAKQHADRVLQHVRKADNFPLTAKGDINTYMLFAELAQGIVAKAGRVGLLVPSGIATDMTTKDFFAGLMTQRSLICLYDFENKAAIFPEVHRSFKFSVLIFGGAEIKTKSADFAFFARRFEDLADSNRRIDLSIEDLELLNPNTKTCPIFRTRKDAELTKAIYRRVPILIDETRQEGGNPWEIQFFTMFHQTNDAELFHDPQQLKDQGFKLNGNHWTKGKRTFLPLYEAKMVQAYDHRAASVVVQRGNWIRQGQTEQTTLIGHQNPEYAVLPRWWVDADVVADALKDRDQPAYLCYKDVTSATNQRTMIASMIPLAGVVNSAPLMLTGSTIIPRLTSCVLANLNSFVLDFVARQKVGNVHLNFFIVKQLPILSPDVYQQRCPWNRRQSLEKWVSDRVLKLTCTANDMIPFAEAADFDPPVRKWNEQERAKLTAELDAAYFILYGLDRTDVEYVLSTFTGAWKKDTGSLNLFQDGDLILEAYGELRSKSGKR